MDQTEAASFQTNPHHPEQSQKPLRRAVPWALFAGLFVCGWRAWDLLHTLPAYDDVLEVLWTLHWYDGALRGDHSAWVYPLAFYPSGWHVATFGEGPAMFLVLLPLSWLGGAAFAYNITSLLTFVLSFAGMSLLARRFVSPFAATLAALLFTFWGFRWFRIAGHLNILLASALLPWMVWGLERWLSSQDSRPSSLSRAQRSVLAPWRVWRGPSRSSRTSSGVQEGRRTGEGSNLWLALVGVTWAITIMSSWYFLWLGAILLGVWLLGRLLARQITLRRGLIGIFIPGLVALAVSAPWLIVFLRESAAADAPFYEISHVASWDASLNSLPVPNVFHPWLQPVARWIYRGPVNEPGQANLGLLACLLALVGLWPAWKDRRWWWPVLLCAGVGLALALGLTLKWNGQTVQWAVLRPLDAAIWKIGHAVKPEFFVGEQPPPPFDKAWPMPGLLLSALMPFWERARVFARYAFLGSIGVYLLAGLGFAQVHKTWAQVLLAGLLIFEIVPPTSGKVPFPPPSHPAFEWLKEQQISPAGVIDLSSWQPDKLFLLVGGNPLWATEYHGQPTVAGASSVWPAHIVFLDKWLESHPHAFLDPEFLSLLRYYNVRFIVFHADGGYAQEMLNEAKQNPKLQNLRCFEPTATSGPWPYPICIIEVPPAVPKSNLLFREGWSGPEEWGRWAQGIESRAVWVATSRLPQRLLLEAFPFCVPGKAQHLTVAVNGMELASHDWQECENWATQITIPSSLVRVGWNELVLRSGYALRPADVTNGQNKDTRPLSIGVNELQVTSASPEPKP